MECPFVFSSSAEIPVFCPREQCPLHVFSLEAVSPERTPAGTSIAWRFSGNSTKVTVFPKNTWTTLLYLLFLSPSSVLFYVLLYFILFIYFSFILSQTKSQKINCAKHAFSPGGCVCGVGGGGLMLKIFNISLLQREREFLYNHQNIA